MPPAGAVVCSREATFTVVAEDVFVFPGHLARVDADPDLELLLLDAHAAVLLDLLLHGHRGDDGVQRVLEHREDGVAHLLHDLAAVVVDGRHDISLEGLHEVSSIAFGVMVEDFSRVPLDVGEEHRQVLDVLALELELELGLAEGALARPGRAPRAERLRPRGRAPAGGRRLLTSACRISSAKAPWQRSAASERIACLHGGALHGAAASARG